MDQNLPETLSNIYGSLPAKVHEIYTEVNPLNKSDYWKNVNKFLEELHNILYKKDYEYSLAKIMPESHFFVTQVCVTNSFDVFQKITILNKKDKKYCKIISNKIAHELLHDYILYLRQINIHKHHLHSSDADQTRVNVHKSHISPPQMQTPSPYMQSQFPMMPHPYMPYINMHYQPPSYSPIHQRPVHQRSVHQRSVQRSVPSPSKEVPFCSSVRRGIVGKSTSPPPPPPPRPGYFGRRNGISRTHNWQNLITSITINHHKKIDDNAKIKKPNKNSKDTIPLNFYTVFNDKSNSFNKFNKPPKKHEVPNFSPVPNYPPPPKI